MLRKLPIILSLVLVAVLAVAPAAMAGKPVKGDMDLEFSLDWPAWTGDPEACPDWIGTLKVGPKVYDMAFFPIGNGKPFEGDPSASVHFFEEIFEVYALGTMKAAWKDGGVDCAAGAFTPGRILLEGVDRGLTNLANSKYHMTGRVTDARGDFEGLEGRRAYMSGKILWNPDVAGNPPQYAPGIARFN